MFDHCSSPIIADSEAVQVASHSRTANAATAGLGLRVTRKSIKADMVKRIMRLPLAQARFLHSNQEAMIFLCTSLLIGAQYPRLG